MSAQKKDSNELTDHPIYARRENAQIVSKEVSNTKEYYLIKRYREVLPDGSVMVDGIKLMTAKGKLTRITYFVPGWRLYTEHDSLLTRFCNDLLFMHEFVPPFRSNLSRFVPNVNGFYEALGESEDKIPEDNFYFVLSRFKNKNKVYVVITGSYNLSRDGNYYVVDVIETNEKQFITINELSNLLNDKGKVDIYSIVFETGSSEIKQESKIEVEMLAIFLKSQPELKIAIGGHTDNIGSHSYNQKLSEDRAKSLKNMIVESFGVDASRISAIGFGESKPIATNKTEEGRTLNRRVEIIKIE